MELQLNLQPVLMELQLDLELILFLLKLELNMGLGIPPFFLVPPLQNFPLCPSLPNFLSILFLHGANY